MTKRTRALISLLFMALLFGVVEDGLAGKKKKKKKKKKKDKEEVSETAPAPAESAPRIVRDIDRRILSYNTTGARELLSGEEIDSSVFLQIADGRVLEQEGKLDQAIARLSAAAAAASADPAPLVYLGEAHRRARNTGAASDAFARAEQRARARLASDPGDAEALYFLGVALRGQSKNAEAISTLESARAANSRDALCVFELGVTYARQKDWSSAVDRLSEAIDMNSGIAYAYYYRGLAAGEMGRKDLLVTDLERFLAMAPSAPEADTARRFLSGL